MEAGVRKRLHPPTYYRRLAASLHQTTKKLTTWTAKVRDLRWREYGMD